MSIFENDWEPNRNEAKGSTGAIALPIQLNRSNINTTHFLAENLSIFKSILTQALPVLGESLVVPRETSDAPLPPQKKQMAESTNVVT